MSELSKATQGWRARIILGYVVIMVLLMAVWLFSLMGPVRQALEDRQREGLLSVANATEVALASSQKPVNEVLNEVAATDRLRLTLISRDGKVIADSARAINSTTASDMQSHASRPEVAAALQGSIGYDKRVSKTDGIEYLYVAIPSTATADASVLRVSMPVTQAHAAVTQFRWTSFALFFSSFALAIGVALLAFTKTAAPVSKLERVRTDFVANASHELKTPVAGIRLLSESILAAGQEGDMEAVSEFAQRLSHESERLQSLVTDLMDLSRVEDELEPKLSSETCDLASVVATSFETRRLRARDAGLDFTLDVQLPPSKTCRVPLSVANATLMVDNLLDNAIAYTEKGGISVRLAEQDNAALLTVADTGIGIPPVDQDRIFERFYRVDTTRSRETGGTGLGLSLVRNAVKRASGTIELESAVGKGSTFTVSLPLV